MSIIEKAIFIVLRRFPAKRQKIKQLFSESEEFQAICEDYRQCSQALSYWNQSLQTDAPARSKEYESLLSDLEKEIVQCLNELKAG